MKISYDKEADATYITIRSGDFAENREVIDGVIIDTNSSGELLGIEILDVSHRIPIEELAHVDIEMPIVSRD